MHDIKFTILTTILSVQARGFKYMHNVVQPLPLSIFRTFLHHPNQKASAY